jgi:hypothetical protein
MQEGIKGSCVFATIFIGLHRAYFGARLDSELELYGTDTVFSLWDCHCPLDGISATAAITCE